MKTCSAVLVLLIGVFSGGAYGRTGVKERNKSEEKMPREASSVINSMVEDGFSSGLRHAENARVTKDGKRDSQQVEQAQRRLTRKRSTKSRAEYHEGAAVKSGKTSKKGKSKGSSDLFHLLKRQRDLSFFHDFATRDHVFLEKVLLAKQQSTVFAPTDDAFSLMDKDILEILNEPEAILQRRKLLYGHVSPFRALCMADLMDGMIIPTALDETSITVNVMFGEIFLSSGTSEDVCLLDADIVTRNGVIHKIGEVFLSEFLQTNGFDLLATTAELSKFSFALAMYGLDDMIQNDLLTIIAPIDSAFPDSSAAVAMELNEATSEEERMRALLLYHLIPGLYPTDFLFDFIRLPTALPGSSILHTSFERIDGTRQHNFNFVRALQVDLVSINTVVHTVSQVLSPRTTETIFPSTFFPTETETR